MADDATGLVDAEVLPETSYDPRGVVGHTLNQSELDRPSENFVFTGQENVLVGEQNATELILAVFVVQFETRRGNEIEWKYPHDVDLAGVEFKALASGSHTITQDFIYFKTKDNLYGLSCYEKMTVENTDERGARMKSVGILCSRYTSLHTHMPFLEEEVRRQLEYPGQFEDLKNYYHNYKHCAQQNNYVPSPTFVKYSSVEDIPALKRSQYKVSQPFIKKKISFHLNKITHPAGCFSQFLKFFGENIFTLWKFVLLQKRILFFSPPPVGIACYRVYCACLMACHGIPFGFETGNNPLFFTNVADLGSLQEHRKYVACTTEKIFESKSDVYDVYVDNQNIQCKPYLSRIGHVNSTDRERLYALEFYRQEQLYTGGEVVDDEKMYTRFFVRLNNALFQTLFEAASTEDRILKPESVRKIGLDPKADRQFLADLAELYGINTLIPEVACCPFII